MAKKKPRERIVISVEVENKKVRKDFMLDCIQRDSSMTEEITALIERRVKLYRKNQGILRPMAGRAR